MSEYTRFVVTEGMDAVVREVFETMEDALNYIDDRYGADNTVDQLVQIDASNDDGESETFGYLEVYDMLEGVKDVAFKTNNYKLTYTFDGYKFTDVVNATDEQTAFEYICWICNDNDDHHFVSAEICDDLPSYWCPVDWVRPDPAYVDPDVARYRSLMRSLEVAGITQHDYYTPELDKVMRSLGYSVSNIILETDDVFGVFNGKYIEYTRQNHYTLRVEIKEDK